jgi:hypothetical protein
MEVTKKEVGAESKEVKRPKIDSAIIEGLLKGYERPTDLTGRRGANAPTLERKEQRYSVNY